jgi:hypothetical protein
VSNQKFSRRDFIRGVRPQLVCLCQRYPPLDSGRIHCQKYAIVFISIPFNIKVALTVRYGHQLAHSVFVVLQFSCRPCDIPKSHLQVVLTKGRGEAGTVTGVRLCLMLSSFLVVSFYLSIVKKPFRLSPSHSQTTSKSSYNESQRDALTYSMKQSPS